MTSPLALAFDYADHLYVCDVRHNRIVILSRLLTLYPHACGAATSSSIPLNISYSDILVAVVVFGFCVCSAVFHSVGGFCVSALFLFGLLLCLVAIPGLLFCVLDCVRHGLLHLLVG